MMTSRRAILAIAAVALCCSVALCDASSVAAGAAHTISLSSLRTKGVSVWETAEKARGTKRQKLERIPIRTRLSEDEGIKQNGIANGNSTLYIDPLTIYQSILGFGGAITEASVTVLNQLPKDKIEEVIQAYYGMGGSRYSVARMHINSCDFSVNSWNFDNATDDFNLTHFDRQLTHEQTYMIPFVTEVLQKSFHPLKIFGSPWSPPAWMKTNNNMLSSDSPCLKNDTRYHQAWADYLALTITTYESFGVPFWGMTVQNEPEYAAPWEACTWTAEEEAEFIGTYLGPVFAKQHPELEIIAFDHNKDHVKIWADVIFSKVSQFVDWIGVHWYSGDGFDHLNQTHNAWPKKHILATEATNTDGPHIGDVSRAEAYAHDILGDLNNFVSGWTDWNIVLDTKGGPNHLKNWCDAAIIADTTQGTLIYQPMYDYLWHFSRFLPPGERSFRVAHMLDSEDPNVQKLELVAFTVQRNDHHQKSKKQQHSHKGDSHHASKSEDSGNDIILIVMNAQDVDVQFNVALSGNKHDFLVDMPAHSIKTLRFDQQLLM